MSSEATFGFRCPACGRETTVDRGVRGALLEHGCVVCGVAVTAEAFSPS